MEAIIFCGIQASGKTTFYREFFLKTHIRISLDMLHTRNKESRFLDTCLKTQQKFVIDNTNPTIEGRAVYIEKAKERNFKISGYFFQCTVVDAIERNKYRTRKELIPEKGIWGTFKKLQIPQYEEGFDELFKVKIIENKFVVEEWPKDENMLLLI